MRSRCFYLSIKPVSKWQDNVRDAEARWVPRGAERGAEILVQGRSPQPSAATGEPASKMPNQFCQPTFQQFLYSAPDTEQEALPVEVQVPFKDLLCPSRPDAVPTTGTLAPPEAAAKLRVPLCASPSRVPPGCRPARSSPHLAPHPQM